jgi:hypothetical protein
LWARKRRRKREGGREGGREEQHPVLLLLPEVVEEGRGQM